MQRTATAEAPGGDITTWDLTRIFSEIDKQFSMALESRDLLRNTPIEEYSDLLEKGSMPDSYRPTLYDFLVMPDLHIPSAIWFKAESDHASFRAAGIQPEIPACPLQFRFNETVSHGIGSFQDQGGLGGSGAGGQVQTPLRFIVLIITGVVPEIR